MLRRNACLGSSRSRVVRPSTCQKLTEIDDLSEVAPLDYICLNAIHMNQHRPHREIPRQFQALDLLLDFLNDRGLQFGSGELDLTHIDGVEARLNSQVN